MSYKNFDVAKEFMSYGLDEKIKTNHLYFIGDVLFSYGEHFPLCIRLKNGFLINSDGYSNTTARHKGLVLRELNFNSIKELEKSIKDKKVNDVFLMNTQELKNIIYENENLRFLSIEDINKLKVLKALN